MLGLVDEFSGEPFVRGKEIVSPMRGVLHSGCISTQESGLLTFKAVDYNLPQLPRADSGQVRT
jgi:hypothetical protein